MLINSETLEYLRSGIGEESLQELVDLYLETSPEVMENLKKAIAENNKEQAAFWGHRLKGASSTLGFDGIKNLSEEVETLSRAGNLQAANTKYKEIVPLYKTLESELKDMFKTL